MLLNISPQCGGGEASPLPPKNDPAPNVTSAGTERPCSRMVVLTLECAPESPGGLVKTQVAGLHSQSF